MTWVVMVREDTIRRTGSMKISAGLTAFLFMIRRKQKTLFFKYLGISFFLHSFYFPLFLNFNLLSDRNKPIKVSPIPIAAIHVISSFNTITDEVAVMTGTI